LAGPAAAPQRRDSDRDELERKRKEHDATRLIASGLPHSTRDSIQFVL
jgi:hypothetical protein